MTDKDESTETKKIMPIEEQKKKLLPLLRKYDVLRYYHLEYKHLEEEMPEITKKLPKPLPEKERIKRLKEVEKELLKLGYCFDLRGSFKPIYK